MSAKQGLRLEADAQDTEAVSEAAVLEAGDNRGDGSNEESLEDNDDDDDEIKDDGDQSSERDTDKSGKVSVRA